MAELQKWKHPSDYGGYSPDGEYVVYTRHRESSILENCNYDQILTALQSLAPQHAYDWRARHWAVGWIEYIMLPLDAPREAIERAREIVDALDVYPILDEMVYSEQQWEAMHEYWKSASLASRVDWCRESGDSIFAARHDSVPENVLDTWQNNEMFW